MKQGEIVQTCTWAVEVAEEYGVPVSTVTLLYKMIRKYHTPGNTQNIIEEGFMLAERGQQDERRNAERKNM